MNRRELLAVDSATLGTSLGGCASFVGGRKTEIESIWLMNLSEEPRTIRLRVERDGTQVYRRTFDVARKSEFGTETNPAPVVREPWMNEPAQFTVSARLADAEKWYRKRLPVDGRSGSCYAVTVRIHPDGPITFPNDSYADRCS